MGRKNFGFTMIEVLIVLMIVGILALLIFSTFKTQLAKGRDGRRKADLAKIQKALEDYMNDEGCYPNPEEITTDNKICRKSFLPYLNELPCDPTSNTNYNYFYSYNNGEECKSWYKIYTKLEYSKDPIIEKVGCADGCGPSNNYNYWVASPNMNKVEPIVGAEDWWIEIGGGTPVPSFPTVTPTSSPTPTIPVEGKFYGCFSGECKPIDGPWICPNINYQMPDCGGQCFNPVNECH